MKKFFKYFGLILGGCFIVWLLANLVFNISYWSWWKFNQAADNGDIQTMSDMLENGYNPMNITKSDFYYKTNHFEAALINAPNPIDVIDFFLKNNIDIDSPLHGGNTPLQLAIFIKKPEIAKFLIGKGANLDVLAKGMTITDLAIATDQPEIIMMIPSDEILIGEQNKSNYVYFARAIKYADTKKTDNRVLDALINQGFCSDGDINEIRNILKSKKNIYDLL